MYGMLRETAHTNPALLALSTHCDSIHKERVLVVPGPGTHSTLCHSLLFVKGTMLTGHALHTCVMLFAPNTARV